ncbi:hypothetical protein LCGC14_2006710 [marine sediment metagenome]|uniref:Uncharacterized protein n=1 Tax=marine sediment metagenome TaxID=412755 RepID=A0A0F9F1L2_9ZZZZ
MPHVLRIFCLLFALSLTPLVWPVAAGAQNLFAPVARVNDRVITAYEREQRARLVTLFRTPGDPRELALKALIDERLEFHRKRAEAVYALIAERARTGHELAQALFGDIAVTQAYLTLSEILGHTDLLLNEGRVREVEREEVVYFEAAG